MGIFGLGPQTSAKVHVCKNCGKKIKPGEHFTKDGVKYCCERCCTDGPKRDAKKKAMTCEFC